MFKLKKILKCPQCESTQGWKEDRNIKSSPHPDSKSAFTCSKCGYMFDDITTLNEFIEKTLKEGIEVTDQKITNLECPECGKSDLIRNISGVVSREGRYPISTSDDFVVTFNVGNNCDYLECCTCGKVFGYHTDEITR